MAEHFHLNAPHSYNARDRRVTPYRHLQAKLDHVAGLVKRGLLFVVKLGRLWIQPTVAARHRKVAQPAHNMS